MRMRVRVFVSVVVAVPVGMRVAMRVAVMCVDNLVFMFFVAAAALFAHRCLPFLNFKFNGLDMEFAPRYQLDLTRTANPAAHKIILGHRLAAAFRTPHASRENLDGQLRILGRRAFRHERKRPPQGFRISSGHRAHRDRHFVRSPRAFGQDDLLDLFDQRLGYGELVHMRRIAV